MGVEWYLFKEHSHEKVVSWNARSHEALSAERGVAHGVVIKGDDANCFKVQPWAT